MLRFPIRSQICNRDVRSCLRQRQRNGTAQAFRSASDQDSFALQRLMKQRPFRRLLNTLRHALRLYPLMSIFRQLAIPCEKTFF
jgi:hypothetical protein